MAQTSDISVVIPLYNKAAEIARALNSVLGQSLLPREVIVVDDGSTDGSGAIVEGFASPLVRLVRQENQGVSAARNRGIREAKSRWVALLDGDDMWCTDFLQTVADLISCYPDCGAYGTAFYIGSGEERVAADTPQKEGVVDFFAEAMQHYVLIPSATVVNRDLVLRLGGFPEGMRLGEDQYLWTKIARASQVAFSPRRVAVYSREASNRSAAIYRAEQTRFSFEELYDDAESELSNEYIARVALGKALTESAKGGTQAAARAIKFFSYTRLSRRALRKVKFLNALPRFMRPWLLSAYNWLAWKMARKGA